jgi:hypothetical protein
MDNDLERTFKALDRVRPSDLRTDIAERAFAPVSGPIVAPPPARRIAAAAVALAVFGAAAVLGVRATRHADRTPGPAVDPWGWAGEGWTELPPPPEVRDGAATVWTGQELIYWGGAGRGDGEGGARAGGFAFDPAAREWRPIPAAPVAGTGADATWTGSDVLFSVDGSLAPTMAFRPATSTWSSLPVSPHAPSWGGTSLWTGRDLLVWGGGPPGASTTREGAALDLATGTWRTLAEAPVGLNLVDAAWNGSEMVLVGALLDRGNRATTRTARAMAYDPAADTWRTLPDPPISPQTSAVAFVDGRVVAWESYTPGAAEYVASENRWRSLDVSALRANDVCYTDGVVVDRVIASWTCGHPAVWFPQTSGWGEVAPPIVADDPALQFGWASMTPAGTTAIVEQTETTRVGGEPYLGDPEAAVHLWAWRPPAEPPVPRPVGADEANIVTARFLSAWVEPEEAPYLPVLATANVLDELAASDLGLTLRDVRYEWRFVDHPFTTDLGGGRFASRIELGPRDDPIGDIVVVVGPGGAADGGTAQPVVTDVRPV